MHFDCMQSKWDYLYEMEEVMEGVRLTYAQIDKNGVHLWSTLTERCDGCTKLQKSINRQLDIAVIFH